MLRSSVESQYSGITVGDFNPEKLLGEKSLSSAFKSLSDAAAAISHPINENERALLEALYGNSKQCERDFKKEPHLGIDSSSRNAGSTLLLRGPVLIQTENNHSRQANYVLMPEGLILGCLGANDMRDIRELAEGKRSSGLTLNSDGHIIWNAHTDYTQRFQNLLDMEFNKSPFRDRADVLSVARNVRIIIPKETPAIISHRTGAGDNRLQGNTFSAPGITKIETDNEIRQVLSSLAGLDEKFKGNDSYNSIFSVSGLEDLKISLRTKPDLSVVIISPFYFDNQSDGALNAAFGEPAVKTEVNRGNSHSNVSIYNFSNPLAFVRAWMKFQQSVSDISYAGMSLPER